MKTFTAILILAEALFVHSAARAGSSSLEIALSDDHVVFTTATNISMEMVFRNVGETNMSIGKLRYSLSVVLDGKEYRRDPTRVGPWNGPEWFSPRSGWRERFLMSDFLVPPGALTSGGHKVALRDMSSESNTLTIFIETPK